MNTVNDRVDLDTFLSARDEMAAAELRAIAARMDELARVGDALDGIEKRFLPWAAMTGLFFLLGLLTFISPSLFLLVPWPTNYWLLVVCLAGLPVVCTVYALRVMPRSRADAEIESLNREHFLPHGGMYFPPGERPASIVLVEWTPPAPERPLREAPRDPRKQKPKPGMMW